ncbi:MAG: type II toxin-antitoxin system VapC family toxin [Planctomycetota bacterium]|nr:MAG: type II toxin-antitoxin system VapC family toxin [Planctomycetota bacterium]
MEAVVTDTSVASLLHPRKRRSTLLAWYEPHLRGKALVLSFQSVAELWSWGVENRWTRKDFHRFERFIGRFIVVPYDLDLGKVWAEVIAHCKRRGRRLESGDAWIIATAVHRRLPLASHDADHLGLRIPKLEVISALTETTG